MVGLSVLGAPRRARSAGRASLTPEANSTWGGGLVGDRRPPKPLVNPRASATLLLRAAAHVVLRHPVATLTVLGTRLLGWPMRRCLPTAAALDQTVPAALARHPAPVARFLRLWSLACRFHRRWPSSLTQAETALGRQVSIDSATTRAAEESTAPQRPSNRRPTPPLARLPHRIEGTTVAWAIDLDPTVDPHDLGREAGGLSLVDPRILRVELERRSTVPTDHPGRADTEWEVVVDFDVEPPAWAVSRTGRGQVLASTNPPTTSPPPQHRQTQEGRSHGDG